MICITEALTHATPYSEYRLAENTRWMELLVMIRLREDWLKDSLRSLKKKQCQGDLARVKERTQ